MAIERLGKNCQKHGVHPLTAITFQTWDSAHTQRRRTQYTLWDSDDTGVGLSQKLASQDAIRAIAEWIKALPTAVAEPRL